VTKFVGKFRKNQDYNDDYKYMPKRKHRNEHSEIKKLKNQNYDDFLKTLDENTSIKEKL
jgi:hypothetical protein